MSALQQLIANSAAESQGSQSEAGNKFEKRFNELTRRRENALKDTKGTARWWLWLIPMLVCDPDTKEATRVELQCALCTNAEHTCMIRADLQLNVVLQLVHRIVGR